MKILKADVFDPALSGDYDTPTRLEVWVDSIPEMPTFSEINLGQFTITHRSWIHSIFSDLPEWNDEDTRECAAIFNSSMVAESREPVMPVTMMHAGEDGVYWQDYYVKLTRIKRILNYLERTSGTIGYEVTPDPTYAVEKKHSWMIAHPSRACVRCVEEASVLGAEDLSVFSDSVVKGCKLQQVNAHRVVPMCGPHVAEWNEDHREKREITG